MKLIQFITNILFLFPENQITIGAFKLYDKDLIFKTFFGDPSLHRYIAGFLGNFKLWKDSINHPAAVPTNLIKNIRDPKRNDTDVR
jgi:hypothetical protein